MMPLPIHRFIKRRFPVAIGAMFIVVALCNRARTDDSSLFAVNDDVQHPYAADLWKDYRDPGVVFWNQPPGPSFWTIDFRIQPMFSSRTSYEFGTQPGVGPQYAPLSKLDWSLDSTWTGFRIGYEQPNWDIHFEWLTPMTKNIGGGIADYDWNIFNPRDNPSRLDSLSYSDEQWREGQKLEIEADYKLVDGLFGLPIELWPLCGFRFQRFNMTALNGVQIIPADGPFPPPFDGDIGTFNQQYYIGYAGTQLRTLIQLPDRKPIALTLQADYGATAGYNIDHHLYYEYYGVHRYTMERTWGDTLHFAVAADFPVTERLSLGLQADHIMLDTSGSHRWVMTGNVDTPVDETWDNGVIVKAHQTSITAYIRVRI